MTEQLFTIGLTMTSGALALWVTSLREDMRRMSHDLKSTQQALSTLRELLPTRYATVDDMKELAERTERQGERIFKTLERIEEKIDGKQDKL